MVKLITGESVKAKYSREVRINKTYNIINREMPITKDNMQLMYCVEVAVRSANGELLSSESAHMDEATFEDLFQKIKQVRKQKISLKANMAFEMKQREEMEKA